MAISHDQFIKLYTNKYIDFDGFYGYQCKDLVQKYVVDVLRLPQLPVGNAKDMFLRAPTKYYTKIKNTPKGVPKKGDIIVWKAYKGNPYGHIAVFMSGNVNAFTSFDQNWPVGSKCHPQPHNYQYVVGWLRKK